MESLMVLGQEGMAGTYLQTFSVFGRSNQNRGTFKKGSIEPLNFEDGTIKAPNFKENGIVELLHIKHKLIFRTT